VTASVGVGVSACGVGVSVGVGLGDGLGDGEGDGLGEGSPVGASVADGSVGSGVSSLGASVGVGEGVPPGSSFAERKRATAIPRPSPARITPNVMSRTPPENPLPCGCRAGLRTRAV